MFWESHFDRDTKFRIEIDPDENSEYGHVMNLKDLILLWERRDIGVIFKYIKICSLAKIFSIFSIKANCQMGSFGDTSVQDKAKKNVQIFIDILVWKIPSSIECIPVTERVQAHSN